MHAAVRSVPTGEMPVALSMHCFFPGTGGEGNMLSARYAGYIPAVLVLVMLAACGGDSNAPGSGSSIPETSATGGIQSAAVQSGTFLQYDEGPLTPFLHDTMDVRRAGVWFTPVATRPCTLNVVQFAVAPAAERRIATGLVYRTLRDEGPLKLLGPLLDSFTVDIPPGDSLVTIDRSSRVMVATDQFDLFIALESSDSSSVRRALLMADAAGRADPVRSYVIPGQRSDPGQKIAAGRDLGIRASFDCRGGPLADSLYTIRLQWDKRPADLDLYLIRSAGFSGQAMDTIYWGRKVLDTARRLDVDVIRDFGMETITWNVRGVEMDSLQVAVFYHAPAQGATTRAVVTTSSGAGVMRRDTCVLKPAMWWRVETWGTLSGRIWRGPSCDVITDPERTERRKMATGEG